MNWFQDWALTLAIFLDQKIRGAAGHGRGRYKLRVRAETIDC